MCTDVLGEGHNLQGAQVLIHLDKPWNPVRLAQREGRIVRLGQVAEEVVLLERNGCFGGNITQVGVEGFAWYRHAETVDVEGLGIEFEERAKAAGMAQPEPQSESHTLEAEGFKVVADAMVTEADIDAGVKYMLEKTGVSAGG